MDRDQMRLNVLEDLDLWCVRIRQAAEVAEHAVVEIHRRIESKTKAGYLQDSIFLGDQVWQIPASDDADGDALGLVYQPALWTLQGYGILTWNALDYLQFRDTDRLEAEARPRFKMFYNCSAFEKALILRDHEQMLTDLRTTYRC